MKSGSLGRVLSNKWMRSLINPNHNSNPIKKSIATTLEFPLLFPSQREVVYATSYEHCPKPKQQNDKDLMTTGLRIAKHIHRLIDSETIKKNKFEHFANGISPGYGQTQDCLIIQKELFDDSPSTMYGLTMHTPLGSWIISDTSKQSDQLIKKINDHIELKMIFHGNPTIGPKWLITEYDSMKLYDQSIHLPTDSNQDPDEQCRRFYKKIPLEHSNAMNIFDQKLEQWLSDGMISDVNGIQRLMVMYPETFIWDLGILWFKSLINNEGKWYKVTQGTKNQQLFKAIYWSGKNSNE